MHKILLLLGSVLISSINLATAAVLIDHSPDGTGVPLLANYTNSIAQNQIIGDQFTLTADSVITGAAIYTNANYGVVGLQVRVLFYSSPYSGPIYNFATTLDLVDSVGASSTPGLGRLHVSIPNLALAAGTYWFALPTEGIAGYAQATGTYSDNHAWINTNPSLEPAYNSIPNPLELGDTFFQIEGTQVPEPSTPAMMLGVSIAGACLRRRSRR